MRNFIALLTIASASASLLERYSTRLSTVPLESFVTTNDFKALMCRAMMRTDILLNEHGTDLVEDLTLAIGYETRQEAIQYFRNQNESEMNAVIKAMLAGGNDLVLAAAFARPSFSKSVFAPLADAIRTYLTSRKQMCLYDYLPIGLRRMNKYLEYFTPIDQEALRVTPLSKYGHLTLIHNDSLESKTNLMIEEYILYSTEESSTRLFDIRKGCAVDVKPGISLIGVPRQRTVIVSRENDVFVYRSDSIEPTILPMKHGFKVGAIYSMRTLKPSVLFIEAVRLHAKIIYRVIVDIDKPLEITTLERVERETLEVSQKKYYFRSAQVASWFRRACYV